MAKFIGSNLHSDNWGEDCLVQKLVEYFDDSYVIYRNRMVFGAQFDVCLLAPGIGIVIFEVKAWKPQTIKEVINGDTIVIKTHDSQSGEEKEAKENPTAQARGYVYKMRSKIRQKTGKVPLVYDMVCFPNLTKGDFDSKGIESVCEYESTLLKEDLETKEAFFEKMNLGMKNHQGALKHCTGFSYDVMYQVRQIFETDLNLEDRTVENTDTVKDAEPPQKAAYSLLAYVPHGQMDDGIVNKLSSAYAAGTKLYIITEDRNDLRKISSAINAVIRNKGLSADGFDLKIDFTGNFQESPQDEESFQVFNCAAYSITPLQKKSQLFFIQDGRNISAEEESVLKEIDKACNFNLEQYRIEHADASKNIMVKAGAGTGKTFTMISRIAYICHTQNCTMKEMSKRIVMITFTNDAADQMKEKIKQYFSSYYMLTGDSDCLAFMNQIEGMQISTIHSYAKKIISVLGLEFGYGTDLSVTSGDYKISRIIADETDRYIQKKQAAEGEEEYIQSLGMPVYLINKNILDILARLHNQSIDVAALRPENFGNSISGGENGEFHRLIEEIIPLVEAEMDKYMINENKVHLNNMMSMLHSCLENKKNKDRLLRMQTGRPQYMFVDEFQDTDDVQIDAIRKISDMLHYRMFVVGDVKQCIYRFRGAKENAFSRLGTEQNAQWETFSLYKNYRTDSKLLDIFHETFADLGCQLEGGEPLLMYSSDPEHNDRLIGTRNYNEHAHEPDFYREITITDEYSRIKTLFDEVRRQIQIIDDLKQSGKSLSDKEREIAILVRENWQAENIKQAGKKFGLEIVTNTGGDLYSSAPALDMLTLANALLHYDESDYLYAFVSSNFVGGGMGKSRMYQLREKDKTSSWKKSKVNDTSQAIELQKLINIRLSSSEYADDEWKDWNKIVRYLRTMPVLQVIRKIYRIMMPWINYAESNGRKNNHGSTKWKQDNYRLNVDLLLEELIDTANMDSLTINSLVDILTANIVSARNVDSRLPDVKGQDYVIKCVTVHKAKGLEYGAVILPYCSAAIDIMKRSSVNVSVIDDGGIKVGYQIKTDDDTYQNDFFDESLETSERAREEARILYVAMTRAIRNFSWIVFKGKRHLCWQNLIREDYNNAV